MDEAEVEAIEEEAVVEEEALVEEGGPEDGLEREEEVDSPVRDKRIETMTRRIKKLSIILMRIQNCFSPLQHPLINIIKHRKRTEPDTQQL